MNIIKLSNDRISVQIGNTMVEIGVNINDDDAPHIAIYPSDDSDIKYSILDYTDLKFISKGINGGNNG